jgi:rod shape-determining protein MreD
MMDSAEFRFRGETHIEVHKFYSGAITIVTILALVLQALLPVYFRRVELLELPLLVTIYFGISRRNPSTGLLLGMVIGILQDSLSHKPLGLNGIAKTLIGYLASSIGGRIDTEHPASRFALTVIFFGVQQAVIVLVRRVLLAQPERLFSMQLLIAAAVNGVVAVALFVLLDRLRKPS